MFSGVPRRGGRFTELVPERVGGIFGRFPLSFDAKRGVFAYRRAANRGFRIYEVGIDGTGLRQLAFDAPEEKALRAPSRNSP